MDTKWPFEIFKGEAPQTVSEGDFLTAFVLKQTVKVQEGDRIMSNVASKFAEQKSLVQWKNAAYLGNSDDARRFFSQWKDISRTMRLTKDILHLELR